MRLAIIGVATLGAVALAAAAFGLGRATATAPSASQEGCNSGPAPAGALTDATRPRALQAGSLFLNRFAAAESPLDGIESVVVTPREGECLDSCPLALRVVGGKRGAAQLAAVVGSLRPNFELLAAEPGLPREIRVALSRVLSEFEERGKAQTFPVQDGVPLRALFINLPRADWGRSAWSVGLALYDHPDLHFDSPDGSEGLGTGSRILICRVMEPGSRGTSTRILAGALEIGHFTEGQEAHLMTEAPDIGYVFASLWGHFHLVPGEVCGLFLAKDGTIYAYGSNLRLVPLDASETLRWAFRALLRRA